MAFCCCMAFQSHAKTRQIVFDKEIDGVRQIEIEGECVRSFTDTKILNISLQCWINKTDTIFVVLTNVNAAVELGAKDNAVMLLKTANDNVIELRSATSETNTVKVQVGQPNVSISWWRNFATVRYNDNKSNISRNINYWPIDPATIQLLSVGVKKIRIQFSKGNYDKEWKKDKVGHILTECHKNLVEYLHNTQVKSIYDNF